MNPTVLLYSGAVPGLVTMVAENFPVLGPYKTPELDAMTELERASVKALVIPSAVSNRLIEALPNLGLIACLGSGFEGVDLQLARQRGIQVTHNPSGNTSSVAEMAVALLLALDRRIVSGDRFVRTGEWAASWPRPRLPYSQGLAGRKVGILGLGSIGAKIAARLAGFEVEIGYHNRRRAAAAYPYFDSPLALARWADVLILAVRADDSNKHMVGRDLIDALGKDGLIVNIARGSVIDEAALTEALREHRLAGAALDVFEDEPNVGAELRALPNVLLTPHEAGITVSATSAGRALLIDNIRAFFAGAPVLTPVPG